ncbi:hypothetical protein [Nocardiopsis sp. CC223A]|uniref:hypothetical protein n=1 Tax=Nocardiopsis sp. CC223A TaxID=3044051 RepID=UPI002795A223|nr:hypothetical protein [Nocardiopsis sp. CC223A]
MHRITIIALLAVLPLTACASGPGSGPGPDEVVVIGEDPRLLVHDFSSAMEALLTGELEYLADERCLVLAMRDEATGEVVGRSEIVWPAGVEALGDGRTGVTVPGLGDLVPGDSFSAGGGPAPGEGWAAVANAPDSCAPDGGGFAVLTRDTFTR